MRRVFGIFCFCCCMLATAIAQPVKYVVIISIDGFRPDFYQQADWATPNLQRMKADGAYADGVRGVFPSVTYPSHTTIMTGALPAKHGIYYNEPFEPQGATGRWYWEDSLIKIPTLWTAAHKAGLTTAAVSWPVTIGAPIDYNFPEIWPLDKNTDKAALVHANTTPKNLWDEIEKNATGKITAADLNSDFLTIDENSTRIASYIIRTYKPNFTAVHLVCVDHNEHAEGRDGPMVRKAIASADYEVGRIIDAVNMAGIKDSTAILIVGDHGFVNIHTTLSPNIWLIKSGLITKDNNKTEWKAIFHTTGASAFLILKDKNDKKTLAAVMNTLNQLPESKKKLFRIVTRAELDKIGASPDAALALAPIQGINLSETLDGEDIKAAHGGTHGYFPDFKEIQTGFIGYGAGFKKGTVIPVMGLEDIAPIVNELMQLNFASPDGILYPGILSNGRKNNH